MRMVLVLLFVAVNAGCAVSPVIACDFRPALPQCQERRGEEATQPLVLQALCAASGGTFTTTACPTDDRGGGCGRDGSSQVIDWTYGVDEAAVRERCAASGEPFVAR